MMEETHSEEAHIAEQLEEAAQTTVTQASPPAPFTIVTSMSAPQSTTPFPSTAGFSAASIPSTPPTAFKPPTPFVPPGIVLPSTPTSGYVPSGSGEEMIPPPPTGGFVPSHGVVSATPAKGHPGSLPPPVGISPHIFTPPSVPAAVDMSAPLPGTLTSGYHASSPDTYSMPTSSYDAGASSSYAVNAGFEVLSSDNSYAAPAPPQKSEGLFGWFSGGLVNKVIEKTKSSVETMITTLDPGMKEVIYSGGDIDVLVTSTKDVKVGAVRQAFQEVFGRATVRGIESQPGIAPQPVGFTAGLKGAEERIQNLRRAGLSDDRQIIVSVENFIAELLPDKWFDMGCVLLKDQLRNLDLQVFTQATPVPYQYVMAAQDQTPSDYSLRWSGLSVTVGQTINQAHPHIDHADWHRSFAGISRREMIYLAAKSLANIYRSQAQTNF